MSSEAGFCCHSGRKMLKRVCNTARLCCWMLGRGGGGCLELPVLLLSNITSYRETYTLLHLSEQIDKFLIIDDYGLLFCLLWNMDENVAYFDSKYCSCFRSSLIHYFCLRRLLAYLSLELGGSELKIKILIINYFDGRDIFCA